MTGPDCTVTLFCDDPSHPRRVKVATFGRRSGRPGDWHLFLTPAERKRQRMTSLGTQLLKDAPAPAGWALDPENANSDTRASYSLPCRKCGANVAARADSLPLALEGWWGAGVSEVTLRMLAATLGRSM